MARRLLAPSLPLMKRGVTGSLTYAKSSDLSQILRRTALKYQSDTPQTFYTLRHVASRFHVPPSAVAAIYKTLEAEGLLTRIRGSKTVLEPHTPTRHHFSVHAAVAVPMPLSIFLLREKYRLFLVSICRELRRRGFAASGVFFDKSEATADLLAKRIKHCHADAVLWYMPDRHARETCALLKDVGVRVVGIRDEGLTAIPCQYEIRRENATSKIFHEWKRTKRIERAQIVCAGHRSASEEEHLEHLLEAAGLEYDFRSLGTQRVDKFLDSLESESASGIVLTGNAASLLAQREPDGLMHLTRVRRVALLDGPVSLPIAGVPICPVDLVMADWDAVASGVIGDLLQKDSSPTSTVKVFDAKAYLQAPLSDFAQKF